jgi:pimeloyl-ACP methyl ester carboxylesterase
MEHFTSEDLSFEVTDTRAAGDTGTGEVVVLLHGFPQDRHCWDAVTPALTDAGYRVLAPDQRGYSAGARPAGRRAYALSRLAADVLALADAAGAERFHLVGHDWGAALAWYVAGHHPDRVSSVAALSVPHPEAFLRALTSSSQFLRSWYMAALQVPWLPEFMLSRRNGDAMRASLRSSGLDPESAARYADRAADRAAVRAAINWDRTGHIEVPTLFVWSDGDRFISRAAAERCGRYVDGPYRFETLAGVSHWLPEKAPEQVATLLVRHLATHPS